MSVALTREAARTRSGAAAAAAPRRRRPAWLRRGDPHRGAPRPVRAARAAAHPAHHGGDLPLRGRRGLVVVRPARVSNLDEFDWQVLPIVAAARQAAAVRAARPRAPGRAHRGVVGGAARWGGTLRPAERRAGSELPAVLVRGLLGWHGDCAAVVDGARVVPDASRPACGACSAPAAAGPSFLDGLRRVLDERIPEAGSPARARPGRGRARSTRRCTGSPAPRRSRRRRPTSCTSPPPAGRPSPRSSTRRCTGRRWC